MIWIDIVLLVPILWFAYKGFRNGFIVELTTLVALVLAVWGGLKYKTFVADLLERYLGLEGSYVPFLSFVIAFLLILVVASIIARLLTNLIGVVQLGLLNRVLGMLFAVAKIVIILSLLVGGLDKINKSTDLISKETIEKSHLYNPFNQIAEKIYDFSGEYYDEVKEKIDKTLEEIDKTTA